MEPVQRWYEKKKLHPQELERIAKEQGFSEIYEISPSNPKQSKSIKIGDKVAVLMSNGMIGYYTITSLRDRSGFHIVGRDETGIQEKGREFSLDSSMCWCFDVGYKVLYKFPWEEPKEKYKNQEISRG